MLVLASAMYKNDGDVDMSAEDVCLYALRSRTIHTYSTQDVKQSI